MNKFVTQAILQDRKITYAVTDRQLRITEFGDFVGVFDDSNLSTILGRSLTELVPELIGSEAAIAEILAGKLPRFELAWVNFELIEGQTVYLTLVNLPHRDSMGQIIGLIHLVQDVTEMGEVHQQLTQNRNELRLLKDQLTHQNQALATANAELRRLDEIKSNFISMAAHELNTPLASISGFVEVLLDEDYGYLSSEQREALTIVQRSSRRLINIVRDFLDVTRIEAERIELVLRPTNLAELLETVLNELRPQLEAKGHDLAVNIQPGLPPALCDETRTIQVLGNLISNAIKYTPEAGTITISLTRANEEGFLQITVADSGVGISAKDQAQLFNRFFRAESASLTGERGTGLGLYITRCLVELHGGRIWFESELGKGTVFHATFPLADEPESA